MFLCFSQSLFVLMDITNLVIIIINNNVFTFSHVPVAQWLEHCVSSAKVVGSIPREHTY